MALPVTPDYTGHMQAGHAAMKAFRELLATKLKAVVDVNVVGAAGPPIVDAKPTADIAADAKVETDLVDRIVAGVSQVSPEVAGQVIEGLNADLGVTDLATLANYTAP